MRKIWALKQIEREWALLWSGSVVNPSKWKRRIGPAT
jgi:hypothetical protein